MAACKKIKNIGDVVFEMDRITHLLSVLYASITTADLRLDDIKDGLLWIISDLESDVKRIIAGIDEITEART